MADGDKKLKKKPMMLAVCGIFGIVGTLICGFGYAASSTNLVVGGGATVKSGTEVEIVSVEVTSVANGAIEGTNNSFTTSSVSMYPQLPNANGRITYTIKTCNRSTSKRFELTNLFAPVASLNTTLLYFENLIVGDATRMGEILEPGACLESEVEFINKVGNAQIAAYQLDFTWKEYNGVGFAIDYMQDMTPTECAKVTTREQKQLIDKRDGKKYWVVKLDDGSCWMAQNLALDISGANQTLYPESSDVTTARTISEPTNALTLDGTTNYDASVAANNKQHSWSVGNIVSATADSTDLGNGCYNGNYYMPSQKMYASMKTTENLGTACGNWGFTDVTGWKSGYKVHQGFVTLADGTDYSGAVTLNQEKKWYDEHYLLGNYYSWNTATAGTGETTLADMSYAPESVCPKGWKLPKNDTSVGTFMSYLSTMGFATNSSGQLTGGDGRLKDLQQTPLYMARAGMMNPYDGYMIWVGYFSSFWTSMAGKYQGTLGVTSYAPHFVNTYALPFGATYYRFFGLPVRCVAT